MAGYLEEYGVADERRAKIVRRLAIAAVVLVIGSVTAYFVSRTWSAKSHVRAFLDDLRRHDYQAAYRDWGCAKGCPDYPFERFKEDWGPKGDFPDPAAAGIKSARYCNGDVIVTVTAGKGKDAYLWFDRTNATLGFAPWQDLCNPRIPVPEAPR